MRKLMATAALAVALCAGASAQDFSGTPMANFTADNVSALLTKIGAENVAAAKTNDGAPTVTFEVSGAKFRGVLFVCKQSPNCFGLLLGVPVFIEGGAISHDAVNGFNGTAPFGKAFRAKDGNAVLLFRYVIADQGIMEGNLASNIANFVGMPAAFARYLSSQTVASNQTGAATTANLSDTAKPAVVAATETKSAVPAKAAGAVALKVPATPEHADISALLGSFANDPAYKIKP